MKPVHLEAKHLNAGVNAGECDGGHEVGVVDCGFDKFRQLCLKMLHHF